MKHILAIDQGTTGSRALVYDKFGNAKASAYKEFTQYFPRPGWVEHDPEEIFRSVDHSIQKVLKKVPVGSIEAIGITNQRETTVVWDRQTGKPVYNGIVWQCRRTADRCAQLRMQGRTGMVRRRTGLPIDAYFSATKVEWILKNVRGAMKKARAGRLLFGTTDSWVLWKLTGGRTHATDFTNASRTMLFNIETKKWDPMLLKLFGIPSAMLPEVRPSFGVFGETVKNKSLGAGIPIGGIAGDQQAALFGQACFGPGTMKNTYGTGAFMLLNTGTTRVHSRFGLITTLACGSKGEPVYCLEGAIFIAGAAVQWLRDGIRIIQKASESEALASSLKGNDGVYFVPALVGIGAPYWNASARGTIVGITRGVKREHLVRAALEAMCYQTRDVAEAMRKDSGISFNDLRVDGGAVSNDFLCQFQADILGCRIIRPKVIETTSLGAAYLAGLSCGYWKNTDEIRRCWKKDKIFSPGIRPCTALVLYQGWKDAVRRTLMK